MKIIITSGHAGSTSYSQIQKIRKVHPGWEIVFVGSKNAFEGKKIATLENTYFPEMGIRYIQITSGRIQRKFTSWTIPSLLKIPIGIIHAFIIILKEKPSLVISFGGYAAFPVVLTSKILSIPIVIHEQTIAAGRANIISGYFSDKIALSRYESLNYFQKSKCTVIGNPVSDEIIRCKNKKISSKKNAILITGGSRGSQYINDAIKPILPELLKHFTVFHQTGSQSYPEFLRVLKTLDISVKEKYIPFPTAAMWDWYKYLDSSDFIISRSGANIVSEAVYLNIPAIYIPIPFSYKDEQIKNARYAEALGLAVILKQGEFNSNELYLKILEISGMWKKLVHKSKKPEINDGLASDKMLKLVESLCIKS